MFPFLLVRLQTGTEDAYGKEIPGKFPFLLVRLQTNST